LQRRLMMSPAVRSKSPNEAKSWMIRRTISWNERWGRKKVRPGTLQLLQQGEPCGSPKKRSNLLQKRINVNSDTQLAREFRDVNSAFNQLSDKLQKSLLAIRRVPAGNLVQKVPRMVRDLANSLGKDVKVEVAGQIDKSMIEALESPINDLVRNSVDHGVERPQERKKAGKSETGMVKIDISEHGEDVIISIEDDGAGIDPEEIRKKAVRMGLVPEEQAAQLDDRDVLQFIFASGFSTARKVSDVSGRGVGMDVVRTNVESLKGSISLRSVPGRGSTVTLRLPSSLTVLVVDGMLVGVGDQQYIIRVGLVLDVRGILAESLGAD